MIRRINNIETFYQEYGSGKDAILLLHGWGQSHAFWEDVIVRLENKYHLYVLDLPGFGLSQEPPKTWSVKDYAEFIYQFVSQLHISTPIIVGHSFGGRIASVYASQYPIKKLILYSNGGLFPMSLRAKFNKHIVVSIGRFFFPNFLYKSHTVIFKPKQYQNKVIINTKRSQRMLAIYSQPFYNLTNHLEKIKAKTLIISGCKDYIVSPKTGQKIHQLIKNSQLVEVPQATHFAHLEAPNIFYKVLEKFLVENQKK